MRKSMQLLLSPRGGGRFSSVLDMGGSSPMANKSAPLKDLKFGKNNKLQAIALDFDLMTRSVEDNGTESFIEEDTGDTEKKNILQSEPSQELPLQQVSDGPFYEKYGVMPNVSTIQNIAKALNVALGGFAVNKIDDAEGQLSNLIGSDGKSVATSCALGSANEKLTSSLTERNIDNSKVLQTATSKQSSSSQKNQGSLFDIRAKYANKLSSKVMGGIFGVDRTKVEQDIALKHGDAAGHLAARAALSAPNCKISSNTSKKWLATTGTAGLLNYIRSRSMKVALIPIPNRKSKEIGERMEELVKQLPEVKFHVLIKDGSQEANEIINAVQSKLHDIPCMSTLVVSDRDDYLQAARDLGMYTCRIRLKNARRGNITTHYIVESINDVEEVINDINGISFNSVFGTSGNFKYG